MTLSHVIEKGFSLRDTRPFFGQGNVKVLVDLLKAAESYPRFEGDVAHIGIQALQGYLDYHQILEKGEKEKNFIDTLERKLGELGHGAGGVRKARVTTSHDSEKLGVIVRSGIDSAILNRHSLRQYGKRKPDLNLVEEAIKVAQRSPSACNLQPTRVHMLSDRKMIDQALILQEGSRGFADEVPVLLIITYDVGRQIGPRSRHQGYCDSGLFSMALMLSLLDKGLGSCPLNWAKDSGPDKKLRKIVAIPDFEEVVMFVSVGILPEKFEVALSERRPVNQILTHHQF